MTNELKVLIGIGAATLLILIGGAFFLSNSSSPAKPGEEQPRADASILVREDSAKTGSSSAKVNVVEFADFQCPACASAHPTITRIADDYKDRTQYVFRHFPLPQHKNAKLAARVSEAAAKQGKFWEMHDVLYENQLEWAESNKPMDFFTKYATDLKLDVAKLKEDIKDDKIAQKIDRDLQDGGSVGVNSTPTFFVNGREFKGIPQYSDLQEMIDQELKK